MLFAAIGQCCCMAVLGGTTSVSFYATGIVAATMLFLFNFFFSVGLLAIPWLLPAEYAPLPIRASAAALASASNWIFTFLVVEITPVSIKSIGHYTYVYFCIFNACFVPIIYFYYPETARLSLEQIDFLFTGPKVLLHLPAVRPCLDGYIERVSDSQELRDASHGGHEENPQEESSLDGDKARTEEIEKS